MIPLACPPRGLAYPRGAMIEIVFETHSTTEDNEAGGATGWRRA